MRTRGTMPHASLYEHVMEIWAAAGRPERAYGLLELMRTHAVERDRCTYSLLLQILAEAGNAEAARAVLEQMKADGLNPTSVDLGLAQSAGA
jgi:pentatricopeptide repeat protein